MILNTIENVDCLKGLKQLKSESVNCCVTSPPYWALRDYGVEGQLGLEPTFEEYITKLCDIFDEVKRALRKDGTCWVNIGDTYSGSGQGFGDLKNNPKEIYRHTQKPIQTKIKNIKAKSLIGIPFRFALEMINRGWILRNTIIWHKPNCMPSSVKDRFTVDFEYVFFFVKNKKYWFEQQTEPAKYIERWGKHNKIYDEKQRESLSKNTINKNKRTVWTITTKPFRAAHFATYPEDLIQPMIKAGCPEQGIVLDPFMGAGTTALVALKQNKKFMGFELNKEYITIAKKRIKPFLEQTKLTEVLKND